MFASNARAVCAVFLLAFAMNVRQTFSQDPSQIRYEFKEDLRGRVALVHENQLGVTGRALGVF